MTTALLLLVGALGLTACDHDPTQAGLQFQEKTAQTERLMEQQPVTVPDFSMDRYLLDQRLDRFNDPNKFSYLYVILPDGTWLKVTIIAKTASTSKRLTQPQQYACYDVVNNSSTGLLDTYGCGWVEAPDEMGTYGESSGNGRVAMSTIGSLIEFGGFISYIYSETPLSFNGLDKPMAEVVAEATAEERQALQKELGALKAERDRVMSK